jgi:hypothetical protein
LLRGHALMRRAVGVAHGGSPSHRRHTGVARTMTASISGPRDGNITPLRGSRGVI